MWEVEPCYGLLRRILFPIYGQDQLIGFGALSVPFLLIVAFDPELALYMGVGAYLGAVLMMQGSTPSRLLLPSDSAERVVRLFDGEPS